MLQPLSEKAISGQLNLDQTEIFRKCLDEAEILLAKNTDYGSSALEPPLLCPEVPVTIAIKVRMSDKLKRLIQLAKHGAQVKSESIDDTLRDFSGYVKLYLIAREREHVQAQTVAEGRKESQDDVQSRTQQSCAEGGLEEFVPQKPASQVWENFSRGQKADPEAAPGRR